MSGRYPGQKKEMKREGKVEGAGDRRTLLV
jgi:hypothetical protein